MERRQTAAHNGLLHWQGAGITLWLPKVTPALPQLKRLVSMRSAGHKEIVNFENFDIKRNTFDDAQTSADWIVSTSSSRIKKVVVAFQETRRDSGATAQDFPSNCFDPCGLTRITSS